MQTIAEITSLHRQLCERWHAQGMDEVPDIAEASLPGVVARQFRFNFLLWHEEDIARSRDVTDTRIAEVKRAIDKLNQSRNDWIEKTDDWITEELARCSLVPQAEARQNTETIGSSIDRLSILCLRIYHLEEQLQRVDATPEHRENVGRKLAIALAQMEDLSRSAQELLDDILRGEKRHKTYRQLKMYNDPAMNPYLYKRNT